MSTTTLDGTLSRPAVAGRLAPLVLIAAAVACADPAPGYTARDSAGVRVVDNRSSAWTADDVWRLGEPLLDLGGADAGADQAFRTVAAAVLVADRVVVAEEDGAVRYLDADGALIRTVGGGGDGPGEFRLVAGGGVSGDTVWLYDYFHRRITRFTETGELVGVHSLEGGDPALLPVGRLAGGYLLTRSNLAGDGVDRLGLRRDTVPYLRFDAEGGDRRAIAWLPGREYVVGEEDGRATMASPPFVRGARHAARGSTWVQSDQERREIRVLDAEGRPTVVARWPGPDLSVTDAALDAEIEDRVARHGRDAPGLRRFLGDLPRPVTRPAHGRIEMGPDGRIWVETAPGSGATAIEARGWHVFRPDGRWLGTVAAPGPFRITQILEDRVVGVWLDALDVEHVQVRPLLRP